MSSSRLGSDVEEAIAEGEARSSSSGDGVNLELRALNRDSSGDGLSKISARVGETGRPWTHLEDGLVRSAESRNVGAGSSHVEPDEGLADLIVPASDAVADDSAGGSAEEGFQTAELVDRDEGPCGRERSACDGRDPALRLTFTGHELDSRTLAVASLKTVEAREEPREVKLEDGSEIAVC